ncbi:MAG: NAD(P)/FAD-dependent oxidoreductase [Clostridia bacterium]|nr:NAD(P)/FAD-dependent oxidoreductase [Clostridia bacterium]
MKKVVVIGGGASGLMAAYAAAKNGNHVRLIEQNEKLGKKIYITGKGRCNVTNDVPAGEFLSSVVHNAKFLNGCIYSFPPEKMKEFLEEHGTTLKTERGNRVFPVSDHASDITKALEKACKNAGVIIHLNEKVLDLSIIDSTMSNIITTKGRYECDCAVVCTGGLSYPTTGSTGDGYEFAKKAGHSVSKLYPALTGITLQGSDFSKLQGLSLKNVVLTAKRGEKNIYSGMGEMLFTHYGVSGPLVLTLSSQIARENVKDITLTLDLKPALDETKLDNRILRDFDEGKNKIISNVLHALLPSKLIDFVLKEANIAANKQVNAVTKAERMRLVHALKFYPLYPVALRGFGEAIITSGGIDVKQINPKTMESNLIKGLYFCGEALDVDAYTGGFNLQIAFSTGYAAGNSIQ